MEEFLKPMALSQTALAKAIRVPPLRINEIVLGKRAITADTDLRLARYFGMSEGFFLQLQTAYELMARRRQIADQLKAIRPRLATIPRAKPEDPAFNERRSKLTDGWPGRARP